MEMLNTTPCTALNIGHWGFTSYCYQDSFLQLKKTNRFIFQKIGQPKNWTRKSPLRNLPKNKRKLAAAKKWCLEGKNWWRKKSFFESGKDFFFARQLGFPFGGMLADRRQKSRLLRRGKIKISFLETNGIAIPSNASQYVATEERVSNGKPQT